MSSSGTVVTGARETLDVAGIVERVRRVIGPGAVVLHEPTFGGREWEYVKECIDSGWVSSVGSFVDRFERMVAEAAGTDHAVAMVNGTAALHLAMLLAGVRRDDEVLVPSLTFIATANAVTYIGAIPHFVDVEEATLGLDAAALHGHLLKVGVMRDGELWNSQTGRRISAVVPMHTFGTPVAMDALMELAADWNLAVVEDAAEAIGATYKGRPAGSLAKLAALSFNGNKTVTTGGGGAVVTNDAALAKRAKHLTTQAKKAHRWEFDHDEIGFNYRLPNINAALGCAQLEQLPKFIDAKRRLAERYQREFAQVVGMQMFREPMGTASNYWLNALILDDANAGTRDDVLTALNDAGVMARPIWKPMSRLSIYEQSPRADLPVAESLEGRIINLPSSPKLSDAA
jgi:perosamine synthetase